MSIPKQSDPQFKIRLPQSLKDEIESHAKENGRSLNAEILTRLNNSFSDSDMQVSALFEMFHDLALLMLSKDAGLRMSVLETKEEGSMLYMIAKEAVAVAHSGDDAEVKTA